MISRDFYAEQEAELNRFAWRRLNSILKPIEVARKAMYNAISGTEWQSRRYRRLASQLDEIAKSLRADLKAVGPSAEPLAKIVARHQTDAISRLINMPGLSIEFDRINPDTLAQFSLNELEKVTSLKSVQDIQTVRAALFEKMGVQGLNPRTVARELVGPSGGLYRRNYGLIETIVRTEASTVYNEQSINAVKAVNEDTGAELKKQIIETVDRERNHPISQVLNGQIREVNEPFTAPVAEVQRVASRLKKGTGGIFWSVKDGNYTGMRLPAHYRERGIVVAAE